MKNAKSQLRPTLFIPFFFSNYIENQNDKSLNFSERRTRSPPPLTFFATQIVESRAKCARRKRSASVLNAARSAGTKKIQQVC